MRRSLKEMLGYRVLAIDGDTGIVYDFNLLEDWRVAYIVGDRTGRWPVLKKIAFAPQDLHTPPDAVAKVVHVKMTLQALKTSSEPTGVQGAPFMRSFRELRRYAVEASDGRVGQLDDVLVDDQSWAVDYVVSRFGFGLAGKEMSIAPRWIRRVEDAPQRMHIAISGEEIDRGPLWDPRIPQDPALEAKYLSYFEGCR